MALRALLLLLLLAGSARAEGGVLMLISPEGGVTERLLLDELRIYTRDLGKPVRAGGMAPVQLSAAELERVAEEGRQSGVEVVVWTAGTGADAVLLALRLASMDLRETVISDDDLRSAARVLALKVRALLTSPTVPAPWREVTAEEVKRREEEAREAAAKEAAAKEAAAKEAAARERPAPPPPPAAAPPSTAPVEVRRPAAPPRRHWVEMGVGYRLALPLDPTWLLHFFELRLAVPLGRLPLAVEADLAFGSRAEAESGGTRMWLRDIPIALALSAGLTRGRWHLSLAARAAVHVLDAEAADGSGRRGTAQKVAVGLGLRGEVRCSIFQRLSIYVSVVGEGLVLRQAFTVDGIDGPDIGPARFGLSAGMRTSLP